MSLSVMLLLIVTLPLAAAAVEGEGQAQQPAGQGQVAPETAFTSEIGMWYTMWWDDEPPFDSHWTEWSRYVPVLGDYHSGDAETIRTHMQWAKQAGVDFMILDDTNGHYNDAGNIAAHIDEVFAVVEAMPAGTAPKLALAIGYGQWGANDLAAHQAEADLVYEQYASSPVYYQWKGKPLLINYTSPTWFYRWDDERFTVRMATGKVSDGAMIAPATGLWGWVFDQQLDNEEVVGVMPGWGTAHMGRPTTPIERAGGQLYSDMWMEALRRNPEAVVIASFNDFAEETAIEAATPRSDQQLMYTDGYGNAAPDWYEQLTAGYAGLKAGYREGYYYQEENSEQLYQYVNGQLEAASALPPGKPTIVLPVGYMDGTMAPWEGAAGGGPGGISYKPEWIAANLLTHWLQHVQGADDSAWHYYTKLASGTELAGLQHGAEFSYIQPSELELMYSQAPPGTATPLRAGFKAHPAWNGENGWAIAEVELELPQAPTLYLTYIPGKVNLASDGITVSVHVNGSEAAAQWITGDAGWRERVYVDVSEHAGQLVTIRFQVGWGEEQLGADASPAYDSFLIGEPLIVTDKPAGENPDGEARSGPGGGEGSGIATEWADIRGHWAELHLQAALKAGIINGYPDGSFRPDAPVTRAQFIAMLARAMQLSAAGSAAGSITDSAVGSIADGSVRLPFSDRKQIGGWALGAIAAAVEAGIVQGYPDGRFQPNAALARSELAVLLGRAAGFERRAGSEEQAGIQQVFADQADIPPWAADAVQGLHEAGLLEGRGGNRYLPLSIASRAEAATVVMRWVNWMRTI